VIGSDLDLGGAQLYSHRCFTRWNQGYQGAFFADRSHILGTVKIDRGFETDARLFFNSADVDRNFEVKRAIFDGQRFANGLVAEDLTVKHGFLWRQVTIGNNTILNLQFTKIGGFFQTDSKGWPTKGNLLINGITFAGINVSEDPSRDSLQSTGISGLRISTPVDYIAFLSRMPQFSSQPYREVARFLEASGDSDGSAEVMIAMEDAKFHNEIAVSVKASRAFASLYQEISSSVIVAAVMKIVIGYGYYPMLALFWSVLVVVIGWYIVKKADEAKLMKASEENTQIRYGRKVYDEPLNYFLYSLNIFLPVVDLHQEKNWWPDVNKTGRIRILGRSLELSGALVRTILWIQILLGWLLSGFFLAGISGLVKHS
jgi:hypothetical protein